MSASSSKKNKKGKSKQVILIHIGNGSVAASVGTHDEQNHFNITYTKRKRLATDANTPKSGLLKNVITALSDVLSDTASHSHKGFLQKKGHVHDVFVGVSSPWYVSKTFAINVKKKEPFIVTKKAVENSLNNEIGKFIKEAQEGVYKGIFEGELVIHEKHVVSTTLNGYRTENPYGKEGIDLSMNMYTSLFSKDFVEKITHVLESHFVFKNITFHSLPFLTGRVITELFSKEATGMIVDITEHTTDVTYLKQGLLDGTVSFPMGTLDIVQHVSKETNIQPFLVESLLHALGESSLSDTVASKVSLSLNSVRDKWLAYISKASKAIIGGDALPTKVFFTAPFRFEKICESFLKEHFTSVSLDNENVSSFVQHDLFVERDPVISAVALGTLL